LRVAAGIAPDIKNQWSISQVYTWEIPWTYTQHCWAIEFMSPPTSPATILYSIGGAPFNRVETKANSVGRWLFSSQRDSRCVVQRRSDSVMGEDVSLFARGISITFHYAHPRQSLCGKKGFLEKYSIAFRESVCEL